MLSFFFFIFAFSKGLEDLLFDFLFIAVIRLKLEIFVSILIHRDEHIF